MCEERGGGQGKCPINAGGPSSQPHNPPHSQNRIADIAEDWHQTDELSRRKDTNWHEGDGLVEGETSRYEERGICVRENVSTRGKGLA